MCREIAQESPNDANRLGRHRGRGTPHLDRVRHAPKTSNKLRSEHFELRGGRPALHGRDKSQTMRSRMAFGLGCLSATLVIVGCSTDPNDDGMPPLTTGGASSGGASAS